MTKLEEDSFAAALRPFQEFFRTESSAGILLLISTAIAILWANSGWSESYFHFWEIPVGITTNVWAFSMTLHHWINDGLMVVFFLVVGLEIKREMMVGELSSAKKAALPILAAIGGMLLPAVIYILLNPGEPYSRGWGIPMATDIAFSLGILALLGPGIPLALKIFLSAFAIVDDIGAVLVIAFFYTAQFSWLAAGLALAILLFLFVINRFRVQRILPYLLLGLFLWICILKSGIHATIAGVLLAMFIPEDPMQRLEHVLHPWVAYGIIPVFVLANAGVSLQGASATLMKHPVFLGILIGLIAGKQLGVFAASWLGVKTETAALPHDVNWRQIYGAGWLGGIGFTMSIFISSLAFEGSEFLSIAKLAILSASLLSAAGGWILLRR